LCTAVAMVDEPDCADADIADAGDGDEHAVSAQSRVQAVGNSGPPRWRCARRSGRRPHMQAGRLG
jgi:hypothetical protein